MQTVRARTGASWVNACDESAGGSATEFEVRLQAPQSWHTLRKALAVAGFELSDMALNAIELSIDIVYSKWVRLDEASHRALLARVAAQFLLMRTQAISNNIRFYSEARKTTSPSCLASTIEQFYRGRTLGIGNAGDKSGLIQPDCMYDRMYVKTCDKLAGVQERNTLPRDKWCVRVERRFLGSALPFRLLADAESFRFESLAPIWKFRRPKTTLTPTMTAAQNEAIRLGIPIGRRRPRKAPDGKIRHYGRWTTADVRLNAKTHEALRTLTRSLKR